MPEEIGGQGREMPKYKCYKEVWALKIKDISLGHTYSTDSDSTEYGMITPEEEGYARLEVSKEYLDKHSPEVGGYYVVYKDGYKSYSPAKAFEEGYTLIE